MKKKLTTLLSLITFCLYPQSENWKIYNNLNSPLPNNKITSTTIDNEGKIFFGTHNGLVVYDGETWKNYNEKFLAPKPFKLYSLTRNQHILGGEKTSITIKSEGETPDSVLLRLNPTQITLNRRDSSIIELKVGLNDAGLYQFELPELFQDYEYNAIVNAKYFFQAWQY